MEENIIVENKPMPKKVKQKRSSGFFYAFFFFLLNWGIIIGGGYYVIEHKPEYVNKFLPQAEKPSNDNTRELALIRENISQIKNDTVNRDKSLSAELKKLYSDVKSLNPENLPNYEDELLTINNRLELLEFSLDNLPLEALENLNQQGELEEVQELKGEVASLQNSFNSLLIANGLRGHLRAGIETSSILKIISQKFADDEKMIQIVKELESDEMSQVQHQDILNTVIALQSAINSELGDGKTIQEQENVEAQNPLLKKVMQGFSLQKTSDGEQEQAEIATLLENVRELAVKRNYKELEQVLTKLKLEVLKQGNEKSEELAKQVLEVKEMLKQNKAYKNLIKDLIQQINNKLIMSL